MSEDMRREQERRQWEAEAAARMERARHRPRPFLSRSLHTTARARRSLRIVCLFCFCPLGNFWSINTSIGPLAFLDRLAMSTECRQYILSRVTPRDPSRPFVITGEGG